MTSSTQIERELSAAASALEETAAVRDAVKAAAKDADRSVRALETALLAIHARSSGSSPLDDAVLASARAAAAALPAAFARVAAAHPDASAGYWRFHDVWRAPAQLAVTQLSLLFWLERGELLARPAAAAALGMANDRFPLDVDDYLLGVSALPAELARYAMASASAGDFGVAPRAQRFVSELFAAFRLLTLKNDLLRRRFDAIKYDAKRLEETVFELSVRGLLA